MSAVIYTDEASYYKGINRPHESVCHSGGEFARGMAHVNGMESFWSLFRKGYNGIFHHMSPKHLPRYVKEFYGRHNDRDFDTIRQMEFIVRRMVGKHLSYEQLVA